MRPPSPRCLNVDSAAGMAGPVGSEGFVDFSSSMSNRQCSHSESRRSCTTSFDQIQAELHVELEVARGVAGSVRCRQVVRHLQPRRMLICRPLHCEFCTTTCCGRKSDGRSVCTQEAAASEWFMSFAPFRSRSRSRCCPALHAS